MRLIRLKLSETDVKTWLNMLKHPVYSENKFAAVKKTRGEKVRGLDKGSKV